MPSRTVDLTDQLDAFVDGAVASGVFNNASEVVREALHLLRERQEDDVAKVQRLREAVQVGIDDGAAGEYDEFDIDEIDHYLDDLCKHGAGDDEARRRWRLR